MYSLELVRDYQCPRRLSEQVDSADNTEVSSLAACLTNYLTGIALWCHWHSVSHGIYVYTCMIYACYTVPCIYIRIWHICTVYV